MKRFIKPVNCRKFFEETKRSAPFLLVKYQLDYESDEQDHALIDELLVEAHQLAGRVNPHPANANAEVRSPEEILANSIAGVVSEYFWKVFLNMGAEIVRETEFNEAATQIDLEIINGGKRIEVRSSFVKNGVFFALCHPDKQFDIIGPYINTTYKIGEERKEFYVRTLFVAQNPTDIIEGITKDNFLIYLTGGATFSMMTTPSISVEKCLLPDDALGSAGVTEYQVVPFSRALDTFQIQALIEQSSQKE